MLRPSPHCSPTQGTVLPFCFGSSPIRLRHNFDPEYQAGFAEWYAAVGLERCFNSSPFRETMDKALSGLAVPALALASHKRRCTEYESDISNIAQHRYRLLVRHNAQLRMLLGRVGDACQLRRQNHVAQDLLHAVDVRKKQKPEKGHTRMDTSSCRL